MSEIKNEHNLCAYPGCLIPTDHEFCIDHFREKMHEDIESQKEKERKFVKPLTEEDLDKIQKELKEIEGLLKNNRSPVSVGVIANLIRNIGLLEKGGRKWFYKIKEYSSKAFSPIKKWATKKSLPYLYNVRLKKYGYIHERYEIHIEYVPNSLGRFLKLKSVVQGYFLHHLDGWSPYPYGTCWGLKYCEVPPKLLGFFEGYHRLQSLKERIAKHNELYGKK